MEMYDVNTELCDVTLRVFNIESDNKDEKMHVGYDFLMDAFGKYWTYLGKDEYGCDLVKVRSTGWALRQWAVANCDKVEVINPENVRNHVLAQINMANCVYYERDEKN